MDTVDDRGDRVGGFGRGPPGPSGYVGERHGTSAVTDNASAGGGTLTVTQCSRGFLLASWQCRGTFAYADPMAQGSQVFANVVLANDPRHYERGAQVGASLRAGAHRAYLWGTEYVAGILVLVLGLVWCAFAAGFPLLTRRRLNALALRLLAIRFSWSLPRFPTSPRRVTGQP